ncbi:hypothetical protein F511_32873 [Dorcoceras hygrometricum]|uniref:RING-type domain-containing protein n=1 Tax=Dorcoceras hygrometricum TaxID=472368 RepID=A0A2Z7CD58_9LAMI|nr:hypothetical protein F511_32873 [Dorcoceras hygrometricum]
MAVAGLHNVSAFGPSLFVESQSSGSSLWEEPQVRSSTRASSLLQMWRELEDEHVVSPSYRQRHQRSNGSDSDCTINVASVGQGSDNGDDASEYADETENHGIRTHSETNLEDSDSITSGQSSDMGDIERGRVRQVFREWMNSGAKGQSPDGYPLNNNMGEQCLGENVRERVRIIKEWVQTIARHGNNNGSPRDEVPEGCSQIEQVRDGLVITRPEIGARRPVRRICGRQTLLDLLLRAQSERKKELRDLSEQRPVSDFAHRNRIQALLRGRFLRNEILITDRRPSMAATELGLLRQRSTVSDLREGFLSKLHNSTSTQGNSAECSSSLSEDANCEAESTCIGGIAAEIQTAFVSDTDADGNRSRHEFVSIVTEAEDLALDHDGAEVSLVNGISHSAEQPTFDNEASEHSSHLDQSNVIVNSEPPLEIVGINYSGPFEVFRERYEPRSDASYVHEVAGDIADIEGNTIEEFDRQDTSTLEEEAQDLEMGIDNTSWHQFTGVAFTEWTDASRRVDTAADQWFRGISDYEQDQIQGAHEVWPNNNFQEAVDSWLDMPTGEVSGSVGSMDTFYFPDNDNVQSMELRELFSRRRVSSLLRSSFRESLDQVLQSHVERQGQASGDWELDTSSPALIEPGQEQLNGEQTLAPSDGSEINEFDPPSMHITPSQPLMDEELPNWPHISSTQHMGTEWEVINELRIDMARLQQRMNNMQSMLEACMELQIELQRSVHQEVSAALNQSFISRGADSWESTLLVHESKWDFVRKGICCICCDSKIDSLLYRCGHMCTCSKCAEVLVQGTGKCPMCVAPIIVSPRIIMQPEEHMDSVGGYEAYLSSSSIPFSLETI